MVEKSIVKEWTVGSLVFALQATNDSYNRHELLVKQTDAAGGEYWAYAQTLGYEGAFAIALAKKDAGVL